MEVWKEYTIDDICKTIFAGGDAVKYNPTKNKTEENNIPIYANSVENEGLYGYCSKPLVTEPAVTVAARGAGTGFVCYRKYPYVPIVRLLTLIPNENVDAHFLYYRLKKNFIKGDGSAIPQLTVPMIKKERITLPSIPTQQKIANILSSLDDKIEVNRRINEQLEELAQALFKSWFVDFEPFKDGEFVESELVKLGDVVKTTSGGTPSRKHMEYYGGNYGWVKSKELNGTFIVDTEETITDEAIAKSSAKLLPEKSILIAMYGATVGQYAILSKAMTCNQAVCALLPNDNYPYTYLFMYAKNKKDELINKAVGSAQQNISQILIKDLDISNDIQKIKDYHKIVSPAFEIIEKNQQEIIHLSNLRDTLLPKLMSGEIDVNEVEI